jgi:hypothetical protein
MGAFHWYIERTAFVFMQVRAADSAPRYLYLYLASRRRGWFEHTLDANIAPAMPNCGFHL